MEYDGLESTIHSINQEIESAREKTSRLALRVVMGLASTDSCNR
jgi:hypothetical protein